MEISNNIFLTEKSKDYELLDSGNGEKLERFGEVILRRPDPQVLWDKNLKEDVWSSADAVFSPSHKWKKKNDFKDEWQIEIDGLSFLLKLFPSKHVGIFPEQYPNWKWLEEKIKKSNRKIKVLNLFANTGGASLACAKALAEVVHLDSSKFAVNFAAKNLKNSNLGDGEVRFIVDDVRKFVEREIRRKNTYDVIILDPPVYGKGSNKEVWKIEEDLMPLLKKLKGLSSEEPLAILLNGYSSVYSSVTYKNMLSSTFSGLNGKVSEGELCIKESSGGRFLSAGIFARIEF